MSGAIRQFHRWMSVVFTAGVVIYMVVMSKADPAHPEPPPMWVGFLALIPLVLLEITGLYLLVLPHVMKWRGKRTAA